MINVFYSLTFLFFLVTYSGVPKPEAPVLKASAGIEIGIHDLRKEDEESIPWLPTRRLMWDDFLCEPKRNTDAVASTSTSLGLGYQIKNSKLTYQITCSFSKQ